MSLGLFADGTYGDGLNGVEGTVRGLLYGGAASSSPRSSGRRPVSSSSSRLSWSVLQGHGRGDGHARVAEVELEGLDVPEMGVHGYPEVQGPSTDRAPPVAGGRALRSGGPRRSGGESEHRAFNRGSLRFLERACRPRGRDGGIRVRTHRRTGVILAVGGGCPVTTLAGARGRCGPRRRCRRRQPRRRRADRGEGHRAEGRGEAEDALGRVQALLVIEMGATINLNGGARACPARRRRWLDEHAALYDINQGYTFNMAEFSIKRDPDESVPVRRWAWC